MRLLNVNTYEFKEFFDHDIPPYGILSHRWGEDEVSYKEFRKGRGQNSSGHRKILDFCAFIRQRYIFDFGPWANENRHAAELNGPETGLPLGAEALQWVWIDTICIDKNSSQELSEAINSMFKWYANAEECYVYMRDVPSLEQAPPDLFWRSFDSSDWFNRGWTLQEMLAPATVVFCTSKWEVFGHMQTNAGKKQYLGLGPFSDALRFELNERISQITGVQMQYLSGSESIESASIARRMSWAANRKTTRVEDEAYCLLGLFGVNMPLLYGEGRKAFLRLQEEIIKRSDDQSIFAWNLADPDLERTGILAPEIGCFEHSNDVMRAPWRPKSPFVITNLGLELVTNTQKVNVHQMDPDCEIHIIKLNCWRSHERALASVEVALIQCNHSYSPRFHRARCNDLRGRRREIPFMFVDGRQETEEDKLYINLSSHSWDECKPCRAAEWILIGEIQSPSANFLAQTASEAGRNRSLQSQLSQAESTQAESPQPHSSQDQSPQDQSPQNRSPQTDEPQPLPPNIPGETWPEEE